MGIFGQDNGDEPPRGARGRSRSSRRRPEVELDDMSFRIDVEYVHNETDKREGGSVTVDFQLSATAQGVESQAFWPELSGTVSYKVASHGRSAADLEGKIKDAYAAVGHALKKWAAAQESPPDPPDNWIKLSELNPEGRWRPLRLKCPGGREIESNGWSKVMPALVKWLREEGHLRIENLPIYRHTRQGDRRLVASEKWQNRQSIKEAGDLWVDTRFQASYHAKNMRTIVQCVGIDPCQFSVWIEPPNA